MRKVALIGYGKMGKEIEKILLCQGNTISAIIDSENDWEIQKQHLLKSDVAIEFSTPNTVIGNCKRCIENKIPVVIGTTGWTEQLPEMLEFCRSRNGSMIYGSNFSIGANLFFKINAELAKLMNHQLQYNVSLEETHHAAKMDAPSGTAITTAGILLEHLNRISSWQLDTNTPGVLNISAKRIGEVAGVHQVTYESSEDVIEITHSAKNRSGFATGAVKSALWLTQNKGIYNFQDIFHLI